MKETIACIRCEKPLEQVWSDAATNQPNDGCYFTTYGQYGSTVFDPMNGTYLEINVCDDCLKIAGTKGLVLIGRKARPVLTPGHTMIAWTKANYHEVPWKPDFDLDDDYLIVDDFDEFMRLVVDGDIESFAGLKSLTSIREYMEEEQRWLKDKLVQLKEAKDESDV